MRVPSIVGAISVIVLATALGCGPKPPSSEIEIPTCVNLWPQGSPSDTIRVALFDYVDTRHVPVWRNDAEEFVFRQLYETLPSVREWPCVAPSRLVESLTIREDTCRFTIRADARFWDGSPVKPRDIDSAVDRWHDAFAEVGTSAGHDDRHGEFHAHAPDWSWLQASSSAVIRGSHGQWPLGTGPYQVDVDDTLADGTFVASPVSGRSPVVQFVDMRRTDVRDLFDGASSLSFDIVLSRDRTAVEYAVSLGRYEEVPLAFNRCYLLVSPNRALAIERGDSLPTLNSLKHSFARDAVTGAVAVPIPPIEWSQALQRCRYAPAPPRSAGPTPSRRIVYDERDATARDLADRIASLAASDPAVAAALPGIDKGTSVVSVGLDPNDFSRSLASGSDFAYVVVMRYDLPAICGAVDELVRSAPWLGSNDPKFRSKALPLTKTASVAIVLKPAGGFGFDLELDEFRRAIITEVDGSPSQ